MISGIVGKLLGRLGSKAKHRSQRSSDVAKLIVVVEGRHDVEFLRRISKMLHVADRTLPDLDERERAGELIFLPIGGGDIASWGTALAGLGMNELHIYDREGPPETEQRQRAAELVNKRPGCTEFTGFRLEWRDCTLSVSSAKVSIVLSSMGMKRRRRGGRRRQVAVETVASTLSPESLIAAKKLADHLGGVDAAKQAVDAL